MQATYREMAIRQLLGRPNYRRALLVVAVLSMIEYGVSEWSDFVLILAYGIMSVAVWGGVAYIVVVFPAWLLYALIRIGISRRNSSS